MAIRRLGGIMGWVAALAAAALATGGWAVAQDSGNSADSSAPAAQQSQDYQGPGAQGQRPRFERQDRGGFDGGFRGRGFDRGQEHRWGRGRHRRDGAFIRRGPAFAAMRLDAPMLMAFRQLNLSEAQRERMRIVFLNARISALQERERQGGAAASRQQFSALLNPGDPDYARAVQAAKDRAVDRIQRATQTQQALYNVLTPAQKTQLTQILAQRRERLQRGERPRQRQRAGQGAAGQGPGGG